MLGGVLASLALPVGAVAQDSASAVTLVSIIGRVVAADDGRGVAGASVRLGRDAPLVTDADGRFTSRVPASQPVVLIAQAIGFRPESATVSIGRAAMTITVTLGRADPVLDTTRVVADLGPPGFAARRKMGKGYFLDRKELEARPFPSVADLMRTVPGVKVRAQARGFEYAMTFDRCSQVIVFLDGQEVRGWTPAETMRMINPATLSGLEVYSSPSRLPAEFRRMDSCGAVVLWTK